MRIAAQCSLVAIVVYPWLVLKVPLLLLAWPFIVPLLALPIVWYFVFDRHRESPHDELLLRLDVLANAIRETRDSHASLDLKTR